MKKKKKKNNKNDEGTQPRLDNQFIKWNKSASACNIYSKLGSLRSNSAITSEAPWHHNLLNIANIHNINLIPPTPSDSC